MTVTERSRGRVRDALERLEREFGRFEVVEKTWDHPADAYQRVRERFAAGTVGGAGVWVADDVERDDDGRDDVGRDDGRVLLVRHAGEDAWSDPGGKQEPGERLDATARRETREETGVEVELVGVRQAHRIDVRDAEGDGPPIHRLIVIFDGRYVSGEPRPREDEIAEVRWWSEHPEELLYPALAEFPIPAAEQ